MLVTGPWVCEDRIPARLLVLEPASHTLAVDRPRRDGNAVGTVANPLAKRHHAQALALPCPVQQGAALGVQGLAHGGCDRRQFLRELEERVAQAVAHADSRKERLQALGGAVEAIGGGPL